jgi:hypothetical protein
VLSPDEGPGRRRRCIAVALLLLAIGCTSANTSVDDDANEVSDIPSDDGELP